MARSDTDSTGSSAAYVPPERRLNVTRKVTDVRRSNDSVSRLDGRDLGCENDVGIERSVVGSRLAPLTSVCPEDGCLAHRYGRERQVLDQLDEPIEPSESLLAATPHQLAAYFAISDLWQNDTCTGCDVCLQPLGRRPSSPAAASGSSPSPSGPASIATTRADGRTVGLPPTCERGSRRSPVVRRRHPLRRSRTEERDARATDWPSPGTCRSSSRSVYSSADTPCFRAARCRRCPSSEGKLSVTSTPATSRLR